MTDEPDVATDETDGDVTVISLRIDRHTLELWDAENSRRGKKRPDTFREMCALWLVISSSQPDAGGPLPKTTHIGGFRFNLAELAALPEIQDGGALTYALWIAYVHRAQTLLLGDFEIVSDEPTGGPNAPKRLVTMWPIKAPGDVRYYREFDYPADDLERAAELVAEYRRRQNAGLPL